MNSDNVQPIRYSKKIVTKRIIDEDKGEERKYQASKLGAMEVSLEGFKIIRALAPSAGIGADKLIEEGGDIEFMGSSQTISLMLTVLSENLTPEHYTILVDKLLGSLVFNGKEVEDWSEHFDEYPGDLLEVLSWLGKETFYDFFIQSTMMKYWVQKIKTIVPTKVKKAIKAVLNDNEPDSKEES